MQHQLESDRLRLSVNEQGAEMSSLRHKINGLEYLWNANPDVWARHAPVLFPIVGKLENNTYQYKGKELSLSQHGFARDLHWKLTAKEQDSLTLSLQQTEETLKKYPFAFELKTVYKLSGETLGITYIVKNNSSETMPFSIGAHPGFSCPLQENEVFADYYLEFEQAETLERHLLTNGLRNGKTESVLENEKELPLSYELFEKDALVFEGVKSDWVAIKSRKGTHGLEVGIKGFPYLGIWTRGRGGKGSDFICIEPWYGVADKEGTGNDIMQKECIQLLPPGQEFSCAYSVRVF